MPPCVGNLIKIPTYANHADSCKKKISNEFGRAWSLDPPWIRHWGVIECHQKWRYSIDHITVCSHMVSILSNSYSLLIEWLLSNKRVTHGSRSWSQWLHYRHSSAAPLWLTATVKLIHRQIRQMCHDYRPGWGQG